MGAQGPPDTLATSWPTPRFYLVGETSHYVVPEPSTDLQANACHGAETWGGVWG